MAMDLQANPSNEILYCSFNQDFTCFVVGTENGFRVYSTDPFRLTFRRDFEEDDKGIGVIAMLFRTNILAFSGGGPRPRFQPHKVVLWDDRQARSIAELSFNSPVKSIKLRRDLVVVAVEKKVYVYGFRSLSLFDSIETISNPKGLCCLSIGSDRVVLVTPGMQKGRALVIFYPRSFGESHAPTAREKTTIIAAHESVVSCMTTDTNGLMLATASEKGTILRIWDTSREGAGEKLQEMRRGADRAEIHSMTFSNNGEFLVVSSDKGTVHIFSIKPGPEGREEAAPQSMRSLGPGVGTGGPSPSSGLQSYGGSKSYGAGDERTPRTSSSAPSGNSKSSFRRLNSVLPSYFSSEWSLAQFRVHDYRCIAAFGTEPNTIVVVCANGCYYKARFDPVRGGEMTREAFAQFDDKTVESGEAPVAPPSRAASLTAGHPALAALQGSQAAAADAPLVMGPEADSVLDIEAFVGKEEEKAPDGPK